MKTVLLTLIMAMTLFASEINWTCDFKEAQVLAEKEQKNILLIISTESCRWCRKLESTTLRDASVVKRVNAEYIALKLTKGKDTYPSHLKAKRVPMTYFLQPDGELVHSMVGYWNVEDFLSIMNDANYKLNH